MASKFDAGEFSDKLVKTFAEECMPLKASLVIERAECQKKMTDEVNTLNPEQMRAVGLKLERRTTDSIGVQVLVDSDARVTGFAFNTSETWRQPLYARHKGF